MRVLRIGVLIFVSIVLFAFIESEEDSFNLRIRKEMSVQTDSLLTDVALLSKLCSVKQFDIEKSKQLLTICRNRYKRIEAILIYFFPGEAFRLNKPNTGQLLISAFATKRVGQAAISTQTSNQDT